MPTARPNIYRIDHVALSVRDMERAIAFYRDLFGMEKTLDREWDSPIANLISIEGAGARVVHMRLDDFVLELFDYKHPKGRARRPDHRQADYGLIHFGFLVDDFQAAYDRVAEYGVEFLGDIVEIRPGVLVAYFYGVEGEVLEIRTLPEERQT